MSKSKSRDIYFDTKIKNTPTAREYLNALKYSPYKTHRKIGLALEKEFSDMKRLEKVINDDAKMEKVMNEKSI